MGDDCCSAQFIGWSFWRATHHENSAKTGCGMGEYAGAYSQIYPFVPCMPENVATETIDPCEGIHDFGVSPDGASSH